MAGLLVSILFQNIIHQLGLFLTSDTHKENLVQGWNPARYLSFPQLEERHSMTELRVSLTH